MSTELFRLAAELCKPAGVKLPEVPREYDCFCQRCGRRDGTRMSPTPAEAGFFLTVCFHLQRGRRAEGRVMDGFALMFWFGLAGIVSTTP